MSLRNEPSVAAGSDAADASAPRRISRRLLEAGKWIGLVALATYAVALSSIGYVLRGWRPYRIETAWIVFGVVVLFCLAGQIGRTVPWRPDGGRAGHQRSYYWLLGAVLLSAVAYAPALRIGLLSDDFVLLELSPASFGWQQGARQMFRPLPLAVFWAADFITPQGAGTLLHGLNIALHVLNGLLLWQIAKRLGFGSTSAVLPTALFLLFPASVEPVVWCSGLQDVLSTTTALVFVNEVLGRGRLVLLAAAFAGALLSKESAVGTPSIAAALVYARDGRIERPLARSLAMGAMVAIVFGLWRLHTADPAFAAPPSRYLLKQILSMALGTLNVPWTTGELRNAPVLGISMAALVAVAGLLLVRHGQRARAAPLALALFTWTIVAVLPVYSMFFVANDLEGSRYLYFASAGWALVLALTASSATGRTSRIISSVLIVLVLLWSATVVRHLATWIVAAAERDRLLAAAALALQNHPCAEPRFVGATDSIAGAFVFRNGLDAALRRRGIAVSESATSACRFVWSGTEFVPSP